MAGGKGTRISQLFPDIPKPLIPIKDCNGVSKSVLEREIESLRVQGFTDIILTVSYMSEKIMSHFGDGRKYKVSIDYFVENEPLGNAGALFKMREKLGKEPFLLLNADAVFDIDFNRFIKFHKAHGGLVSLFTHPNSHPYDSGLVISDSSGTVISWLTKEDMRSVWYKNRVNAGLHVIDPTVLDITIQRMDLDIDSIRTRGSNGNPVKVDLDRQVLKPLCGSRMMYCYNSPEYVKDMGTPERFYQVQDDFKSGTVAAKNLRCKQEAIFLDRDGTINKYVGFLRNIDDFQLIDDVAEAIKRINNRGYHRDLYGSRVVYSCLSLFVINA